MNLKNSGGQNILDAPGLNSTTCSLAYVLIVSCSFASSFSYIIPFSLVSKKGLSSFVSIFVSLNLRGSYMSVYPNIRLPSSGVLNSIVNIKGHAYPLFAISNKKEYSLLSIFLPKPIIPT